VKRNGKIMAGDSATSKDALHSFPCCHDPKSNVCDTEAVH